VVLNYFQGILTGLNIAGTIFIWFTAFQMNRLRRQQKELYDFKEQAKAFELSVKREMRGPVA
jgi:hypothetical protein